MPSTQGHLDYVKQEKTQALTEYLSDSAIFSSDRKLVTPSRIREQTTFAFISHIVAYLTYSFTLKILSNRLLNFITLQNKFLYENIYPNYDQIIFRI